MATLKAKREKEAAQLKAKREKEAAQLKAKKEREKVTTLKANKEKKQRS